MISANNLAHWIVDPLEKNDIKVLRAMLENKHAWASDLFTEAYLIARECIEADMENQTYRLTEKGEEALKFFGD